MENSALLRNPCFLYPAPYCRQSTTLWQKCGRSHSLNSVRNILELFSLRNSPRQSAFAEAFANAKRVFFCTYPSNIFAEAITVIFSLSYLLNSPIDNFIEIYNLSHSLLTSNYSYSTSHTMFKSNRGKFKH